MEQAKLGEDLSQYIVDGLANSKKYSQPRKGARGFYAAADREQAKMRGRLLEDRNFCKIGTDYEIEFLVIIDIEKAGRGNSIFARILDLETCKIIATGENTSLVRNDQEARAVANDLVAQLLKRSIGKRGGGAPVASSTPAPAPRGNQIAAYVFGMDQAKLGEDLSQYIVDGLANSKKYSQPRKGARGFFQAADREQAKNRGRMLEDRNFCKIGTDYEIEYLVIIDIQKAGRGNSVWARILDLETCNIIATGENTSLIRNDQEAKTVANDLVTQLLRRSVGKRSTGGGGAPINR
jgi:uncharacterized protein YjbK